MAECLVKPYKNIEDQIKLLKSRGLETDERTAEWLKRVNYYNVINRFGKPFLEEQDTNKFRPNTSYDDVLGIYRFDFELKKIILPRALYVEKMMKSLISYHYSNKYPDKKSYLDRANYKPNDKLSLDDLGNIEYVVVMFEKIIDNQKTKKGLPVNHYLNSYGHIPLWIIIDELTFAQMIRLYAATDQDIKNKVRKDISKIAKKDYNDGREYKIEDNILVPYLSNIKSIRNICAHGSRLMDYSGRDTINKHKDIHCGNVVYYSESTLRDVLVIFKIFLPKNEFNQMIEEIEKLIDLKRGLYENEIFEIILSRYGFDRPMR